MAGPFHSGNGLYRRALVAANRELIARFEQKIQATLARIWGEEALRAPEVAAELAS
jgi:type I restriction enzyme M protein